MFDLNTAQTVFVIVGYACFFTLMALWIDAHRR